MAMINRGFPTAGRTGDYVIPGVGMHGVGACRTSAAETFDIVFSATIAQIRAATNKPVRVSEAAISPGRRCARSPGREGAPSFFPGDTCRSPMYRTGLCNCISNA